MQKNDMVEVGYVPDEEDLNSAENSENEAISFPKTQQPETEKYRSETEALEGELEKITKERDEFKDKYLRSLAEVDNFRKRMKKEKEDYQKYVLADFLMGLLEVLDNFERALKTQAAAAKAQSDPKSILSGVEMIHKQLLDLLRRNNVEEIDSLGKPFDPNLHQALSKEERDNVKEPLVVEVYQKGFNYNGKLLRPALTRVAMPVQKLPAEGEKPSFDCIDEDAEFYA